MKDAGGELLDVSGRGEVVFTGLYAIGKIQKQQLWSRYVTPPAWMAASRGCREN